MGGGGTNCICMQAANQFGFVTLPNRQGQARATHCVVLLTSGFLHQFNAVSILLYIGELAARR